VRVIGGGRSGLAAAELLVSRGARVTLADTAASIAGSDAMRVLGVRPPLPPVFEPGAERGRPSSAPRERDPHGTDYGQPTP